MQKYTSSKCPIAQNIKRFDNETSDIESKKYITYKGLGVHY